MKLNILDPKINDGGMLVEAYKLPHDGQIMYVNVDPGVARGNHYHLRKTEHFLVASGEATIASKDRKTGNVMYANLSSIKPMVATITPNHTHSVTAGPNGCIFLVWCDEQYDDNDPDTYPEEL